MEQSTRDPIMTNILQRIRKNWFLLGVVCVITCAKLWPWIGAKGGPLKPEITVKYVSVMAIFLCSGMSMKTEDLTQAMANIRLHVFVQSYTLILVPCLISMLVQSLKLLSHINPLFLQGLLVVGCMPPPVSSAVILTKAVGGNDAAAVFNSALGSFLGIMVTPLLLLYLIGTHASVPFFSIVTSLSLTVLFPLLLGQVIRGFILDWIEEKKPPFGTISSSILLFIIYTTFSDTFKGSAINLDMINLLIVILIVFCCQATFLCLSYMLSTYVMGFTRGDTVAVMFCSTHKSLTLAILIAHVVYNVWDYYDGLMSTVAVPGIPMVKIVFATNPELSTLTVPLLVYHPTQILLGGFLVPFLQSWITGPSIPT